MQVITPSEASARLSHAMDDVCRDHEPIIITRRRGQHVVLTPFEDFSSLNKSIHLLEREFHGDPAKRENR